MKNKGFTLIELVVVIVILGILAVVAAPRFLGLQSDARAAVLEGVEGTLRPAFETFAAKTEMPSAEIVIERDIRYLVLGDEKVRINAGNNWPAFIELNPQEALDQFKAIINIDATLPEDENGEFSFMQDFDGGFFLYPKNAELSDETFTTFNKCYVRYVSMSTSGSGRPAQIFVETDDC